MRHNAQSLIQEKYLGVYYEIHIQNVITANLYSRSKYENEYGQGRHYQAVL